MLKCFFYFLFLIISFTAGSQNLVRNYSFEDFEVCPDEVTVESIKELIPFWYMPNRGTSDYFNSCAIFQVSVPDNVMGSMLALDGHAYAGLVLLERPPGESENGKPLNYREYLQTELTELLKKDSLYEVKFYFSIASYSTYAVNKLGLYLSEKKIGNRLNFKVIDVEPQIKLDTNLVCNERDYWYQVCDTFRAKGNETFITIGNFNDDYETGFEKLDYTIYRNSLQQTIKENKIAYYYIDVVYVIQISDTTTSYCNNYYLVNDR